MQYEDFFHVESFLVSNDEEKYVNELIQSGWKLISVVQYKDDYNAYGRYVLGADKKSFEKRNFKMIQEENRKENDLPF